MNVEDLIQLLNNRLREFKLSRDYAKMSGDFERMNVADKEVLALEDTLFKLKLLVDTSKSAEVKEEILAEVITDGSISVLGNYDITPYATDPLHEEKIMNILSNMGVMDTVEKIDEYINGRYISSPVTGAMVMSAANAYNVDIRLLMAMMQQDSSFGTAGLAVRTLNPGNVGNDDDGNIRTYGSWQEGVTAVAEWLNRHRITNEDSEETTPIIPIFDEEITPIATSTTTTATTTPIVPITGDITPITTSTTTTSTTTPIIPIFDEEITPIATSTTTTSTTTPITITPTPTTTTSTTTTATNTPIIPIFDEEITPVVTSVMSTTTTDN
jgi:hypothetical protein